MNLQNIRTILRENISRFAASGAGAAVSMLVLSWFYAICSQVIIPLPFNLVPISIQPLPLFTCAFFFGHYAVGAYFIYLAQGALGLPFFSALRGGIWHLWGPTGGYLLGFGLAMIMIVATRSLGKKTVFTMGLVFFMAHVLTFACGLAQLALFVPSSHLLSAGLYPFLVGDFVIKFGIELSFIPFLKDRSS